MDNLLQELSFYYANIPEKEAISSLMGYDLGKVVSSIEKPLKEISKHQIRKLTEARKRYIELKSKFPKFIPGKISKQDYQLKALEYLIKVPEQFKLTALNDMQDSLDFVIADINLSEKTEKFKYGLADLLRFLGIKTTSLVKITGNPLYEPIEYPIPDYEGNSYLSHMSLLHDHNKYVKLLVTNLGEAKKILKKKDLTPEEKALVSSKLYQIFQIRKAFEDMKYNPLFISKSKESRPMEEYRSKHFTEIFGELKTYEDSLAEKK